MKLLILISLVVLATAEDGLFAVKLFDAVAKSKPGKSLVISGFSVLSPLAQLGLGSVGESHDEILKAIALPNDETAKEVFSVLNRNLRSLDGIELKIANRVYIPEGRELNETFAKMSREVFGSDVKNVDFSKNELAAADVNAWVEEHTNHLIKDLVTPNDFSSDTKVLVNAVYFKGEWESKFEKAATLDRDFHVSKDKTIKIPIMYNHGRYRFGHSDNLKAKLLELFYKGGKSSILFVLPDEVDGLPALEDKLLDPLNLQHAISEMREAWVDVFIPRFKIKTTTDLKEVLQKIGVKKLFGSEAKLDYIVKSERDLYISGAIQKAYLDVSEDGVEAAAASEFGLVTAVAAQYSENFLADRPFYFTLRSGEVSLFSGVFHE